MISRDNATLARDNAYYALRATVTHAQDCERCSPEDKGERQPCQSARYYQDIASKLVGEARQALTAYAPRGTRVIYRGTHSEFHGEYTVNGPAAQCVWGAYHMTRADGQVLDAAPLGSIHLTEAAAAERDRINGVRAAAAAVAQVLAARGLSLQVNVDRRDNGQTFVTWSSVDFVRLENQVAMVTDDASRQYLASALGLLRTLRTAANRDARDDITKVTVNARKILQRLSLRKTARGR